MWKYFLFYIVRVKNEKKEYTLNGYTPQITIKNVLCVL